MVSRNCFTIVGRFFFVALLLSMAKRGVVDMGFMGLHCKCLDLVVLVASKDGEKFETSDIWGPMRLFQHVFYGVFFNLLVGSRIPEKMKKRQCLGCPKSRKLKINILGKKTISDPSSQFSGGVFYSSLDSGSLFYSSLGG